MYTNEQVDQLASNASFQGAVQVACIVNANAIHGEIVDSTVKSMKRNILAQQIINDIASRTNVFSWLAALDENVQNAVVWDGETVSIADAVINTAVSDAWDKVAGVITGDEVPTA